MIWGMEGLNSRLPKTHITFLIAVYQSGVPHLQESYQKKKYLPPQTQRYQLQMRSVS
jgi:hypothetical protein